MLIELKDAEIVELNKKGNICLYFSAPWCGSCKAYSITISKIAEALGESVKIYKIDVDINPKLTKLYGVISLPTFIVLDNEREVKARITGAVPFFDVRKVINTSFEDLNSI